MIIKTCLDYAIGAFSEHLDVTISGVSDYYRHPLAIRVELHPAEHLIFDCLRGIAPLVQLYAYCDIRGLSKVKSLIFCEIDQSNLIWRGSLIEGLPVHCLRDTLVGQREHLEELDHQVSLGLIVQSYRTF